MFKKSILLLFVVTLSFGMFGCAKKEARNKIDYAQYAFTDKAFTRKAEHDTETIWFGSDGSFTYSCGCGNPVNDSDLSEGYTYDDKTKTITINYMETTDETVSQIKIESYDDKSITLDFDGEIREFVIGLS